MKICARILFLCYLFPLAVIPAWADIPSGAPSQPNIKILSDQMDCDQSRNICTARGNASAEKLGDTQNKVLKAEQITAHFSKSNRSSPMKVMHLEAEGNVIIFIGDVIIQGQRGNYVPETDTAEIYDNVKITSGRNQLEGSYGKVNMKTGQYILKRKGERVQALLYAKDSK